MDFKQKEIMNIVSKVLFAIIIAAGMIVAAQVFSNTIADRSLIATFNGSLSQSDYNTKEMMDINELRNYLSIYPTQTYSSEYDNKGNPISGYEFEEIKLRDELARSITSGTWPDFPYVKLGERLYFSKQAVDDWFYAQGKVQLNVK